MKLSTNIRSVSIDKNVRKRLLALYKGTCAGMRYYTKSGDEKKCKSRAKLQIDHVYELHNGGLDVFENLQPLCRTCHSKKSIANRKAQFIDKKIPF